MRLHSAAPHGAPLGDGGWPSGAGRPRLQTGASVHKVAEADYAGMIGFRMFGLGRFLDRNLGICGLHGQCKTIRNVTRLFGEMSLCDRPLRVNDSSALCHVRCNALLGGTTSLVVKSHPVEKTIAFIA